MRFKLLRCLFSVINTGAPYALCFLTDSTRVIDNVINFYPLIQKFCYLTPKLAVYFATHIQARGGGGGGCEEGIFETVQN